MCIQQHEALLSSHIVTGHSEMGQTSVSTLTQEVESFKVVIDLRNTEISQLKQSNAELKKEVGLQLQQLIGKLAWHRDVLVKVNCIQS